MKYSLAPLAMQPAPGLWRWAGLLPPVDSAHRVTLHEGNTPLVPLTQAAHGPRLLLKNETGNPTWSWKDRPNAVSISVARHFGFSRAVAKSTGNHGNAVAAYSAAAGIAATVLCNPDTPALQLALMEGYGARVVRGGCQDKILDRMVASQGYFPCTILCPRAGYSNPFGIEGFKTIAFEIVEALGGVAPARVFIPVGSGDGVYGIWKGFRELAERNRIPAAPKIVACQPEGANSAAKAWREGRNHASPLESMSTAALSVAEPVTGDHALRAVYESGGEFREVSEFAIREAAAALRKKGFALELASALPYACAAQPAGSEPSAEGETWVLIGSGAAVKWPETLLAGYCKPAALDSDLEELPDLGQ
jgi:threonine synthase